jgi:hypothetical protein
MFVTHEREVGYFNLHFSGILYTEYNKKKKYKKPVREKKLNIKIPLYTRPSKRLV